MVTNESHYIMQAWMPSGGYAYLHIPRNIDAISFGLLKELIDLTMTSIRPTVNKLTAEKNLENPARYHAL